MQILVAGASGMIGARLVARLRAEGHDVRTLVRREPRAADERRWDPDAGHVPDDEIAKAVVVSDSVTGLVEQLREYEELGFDEVYLHHVGQDQAPFLELAERELLPALRA